MNATQDQDRLPFVIVSHTLPESWLSRLDGRCRLLIGPETTASSGLAPELAQRLPEADGLFALLTVPVGPSLLEKAPRLRVVSNMAVGVDNVDLAACTERGIPVGHTPGVLTEGTADLTMALLLAAARRLPEASQDARLGRWTTWEPAGWLGADLTGATLGIVGMGKIGTAVAQRAAAFGLRLVYNSRSPKPDVERQLGARPMPLDDLLRQSDFVSLHVPLTAETRYLIDRDALRLMKPSAILINVARGPVVDSAALYQALHEGQISAAGLDVTDPEPLPPGDPLYSLPNCLIVPHIGSATVNTRRRMAELACDNLLAGLAGKKLPHCANPAVYAGS
ncbi:MAG: D-glycerate dehydrogenase [Chloroflexota bacterium]|jgi:lactate dehydrogenase-like 2-hydroxyacid dehydrogenase